MSSYVIALNRDNRTLRKKRTSLTKNITTATTMTTTIVEIVVDCSGQLSKTMSIKYEKLLRRNEVDYQKNDV